MGRPARDNRGMVNAIVWVLRTGYPWRDLPPSFESWQSVHIRFSRWRDAGVLEKLLAGLRETSGDADDSLHVADSSVACRKIK